VKDATIMTKLEELDERKNTIGILQNKCDSIYEEFIDGVPSCIHDYIFDYLFNDILWVKHEIKKVLDEEEACKNEVTMTPCDNGFVVNKTWSQSGNCSSIILTKQEIIELYEQTKCTEQNYH
jgi:hypothetical protein